MVTRILYVEDNPQNMRIIEKILTQNGYEVLQAINGVSGVEVAQEQKPDLILMDINLPDIDGLEATTRIKSNPELESIPVVALTGHASYGDEERARGAGCDGYLSKPVSRARLIEEVQQFLNIGD